VSLKYSEPKLMVFLCASRLSGPETAHKWRYREIRVANLCYHSSSVWLIVGLKFSIVTFNNRGRSVCDDFVQ
jgi:hypothetical protein